MTTAQPTIAVLSSLDESQFTEALGNIFEHSPWVAAAAWKSRPFTSIGSLHGAMVQAMLSAGRENQIALIRAHPQLGGAEARNKALTANSAREQSRAGLDHCDSGELEQLRILNAAYLAKFGFPFVMAVRNRSRFDVFSALAERTEHSVQEEFARCLDEIGKIAEFRLRDLLEARK